MARGRHRYIPPRRLVVPAGVGGCGVLAAGAAVLTGDITSPLPVALIALSAAAAVAGAVLMRRRDSLADARVARERASRGEIIALAEQRQIELAQRDAELAEASEQITALEEKLQGKRIDLGRLRTEHASLLRRYAHAEHGRANALESRRVLELEAANPTRALPSGPTDHRTSAGAPTSLTYLQAAEALRNLSRNAARQRTAPPETAPPETAQPAPGQLTPAAQPQRVPSTARQPYPAVRPQPLSRQARPPQGGFDYFGTSSGTAPGASRPDGDGSQRPEQG